MLDTPYIFFLSLSQSSSSNKPARERKLLVTLNFVPFAVVCLGFEDRVGDATWGAGDGKVSYFRACRFGHRYFSNTSSLLLHQ